MSSHAAVSDLSKLPGAGDDPSPTQSSYWMLLMFVFMAFSIFACTWLALEWMEMTREERGPSHAAHNELERVWDNQDADLAVALKGDKLTLKDGTVIDEGVVVQYTDSKGKQWVAVKTVRYAHDYEAALRSLQSTKRIFPTDPEPRKPRFAGRVEAIRMLDQLDLLDKTINTAAKNGKELKFTPGEVDMASIQAGKGKGKTLCVPLDEGRELYLKDRN